MSYTLLRSMKVKTADGRVELRQPGDKVPEAATWRDPGVWVKRGYIKPDSGDVAYSMHSRGKKNKSRSATPEEIAERETRKEKRKAEKVAKEVESEPINAYDAEEIEKQLKELSKHDLMSLAEGNGIQMDPSAKKADIIQALLDAKVGA